MKKVFFFLTEAQDLDLVAITRRHLQKLDVTCQIDYVNLDLHTSTYSKGMSGMVEMYVNYKLGKEVLIENKTGHMKPSAFNKELIAKCLSIAEKTEEYDLYCFPTFSLSMIYNINIALLLKRKYPKAGFLFGGPEVALVESTRRYLTALDLDWTIGDVEVAIYNALSNTRISHMNSRGIINDLTIHDYPIYTDEEMKGILDYRPRVHLSRGCINRCNYCPTPGIYEGFNAIKRNVAVGWLGKFVEQGAKEIRLCDTTLNSFDFDKLLNGMLYYTQMKGVNWGPGYVTLRGLTEDQVAKMAQLFHHINPGIECINPVMGQLMNKRHPSREEVIKINEWFYKYNLPVNYQYIVGIPGHTDELVDDELTFMKQMADRFPNIRFEVYQYIFIPGSIAYNNYKEFGYNIQTLEETTLAQFIREFTEGTGMYKELMDIFSSHYVLPPHPHLAKWFMRIRDTFPNYDLEWDYGAYTKGWTYRRMSDGNIFEQPDKNSPRILNKLEGTPWLSRSYD